jgi:hypothetical protein
MITFPMKSYLINCVTNHYIDLLFKIIYLNKKFKLTK